MTGRPQPDSRADRLTAAGWQQHGPMWTHPRYGTASFTLAAAEHAEEDPDRPRRMLAETFGRTWRAWARGEDDHAA